MKKMLVMVMAGIALFSLSACAQEKQGDYLDYYVETFDEYSYGGETDVVFDVPGFDARSFVLQDIPENEVEELVANHYFYELSSQFDKLSDIYGENESLKRSVENEKKSFEEGYYVKEHVLHSIVTLTKDDILKGAYTFTIGDTLKQDVSKYQLSHFSVVQVDLSLAWSQEALKLAPQIEDGEYNRFFLCGKSKEDNEWKIYELYWE